MSNENANSETQVELNAVEWMIAEFQGRMTADNSEHHELQVQGWMLTWKQVQEAYRIGRSIVLDAGNAEAYKAALKRASIPEAGEKANKWLPFTKLVFGKWDAAETVFCVDRSAEKYANYFRYFEDEKVQVEHVIDTIKKASVTEADGKIVRFLKAIEKMDREAHRAKSSGFTPEEKLSAGLNRKADDVFRIAKPETIPNGVDKGTLWFEVDGDELVVYGCEELKVEAFEKLARKKGAALLAKVNDLGKQMAVKIALGEAVSEMA